MRLQLATVLVLVAIDLVGSGAAHADGTLSMRGVYYKERSTRVMQPMLDGMFEVGARGLVTAHVLVDAITSASAGSGTANAVPFSEKRYEAGVGYTQELDGPAGSILDKVRVGGDARFSIESDYRSIFVGPRAEADIAQKNLTVGVGGGYSADRVDASGAASALGRIELLCKADVEHGITQAMSDSCPLNVYNAYASVAQIVSKNAVVGANYDIAYLDGYQSNPYRTAVVPALGTTVFERHPFTRLRQSVAASARYYLPRSQTTFIGAYRYYWDSWGIHAHTPELRIVQEVGSHADATVGYRFYTQDAAFFYARFYPPPTATRPFITNDPKMSAFNGDVMTAKLGVFGEAFGLDGRWAGARFEGILQYIIQHNRFGNAVEANVALTLPISY